MKVLRIVRNVVLLVLAVCFCAVMALCVLGWQMYTQALEAMPLDQKVRQVQSQESYTTFEELPDTYVEPAQMTPDQCTLLAGIPNAPSVYDPTVNPDLASQRQRQVLQLMVKYEYLTATEAVDILAA